MKNKQLPAIQDTGSTKALAPIKKGSKYSLIISPIKNEQLLRILQKTPREHVYTRPAKGGGTWDFVTGTYVKKVLNFCFGWLWDFIIIDKGREGDQVWVQGRLIIKNPKGVALITKEQFGRAEIKFMKGTKTPLDYGNDLKAAATDALKKCAAELGIASDIYGKNEFQDILSNDTPKLPQVENRGINTNPTPKTTNLAHYNSNQSSKNAGHGQKNSLDSQSDALMAKIKAKLFRLGAKNEAHALRILKAKTKIEWKSFTNHKPAIIRGAWLQLLNSK